MKKLGQNKNKIKNKKVTLKNKENLPETNSLDPKAIQQLIFQDIKNINKLNSLIEEFIISLQNSQNKKIQNISKIILEVYEYFFITNENLISGDLKLFLDEKLNMILQILVDVINISPNEESDVDHFRTNLKIILKFLPYAEAEKINLILVPLIKNTILNNALVDANVIKVLSTLFLNLIDDKNEKLNFEILINLLYNEIITDCSNLEFNESTLFNIYNFIISIPQQQDSKIKLIYQNLIIFLVNKSTLPKEILQNLLINLNKIILDNLENPLIFSDYLINIYENSSAEEFDIKILSLSGLFVLITKFKLDYNNYYNYLYRTISLKNYDESGFKTVFDSKYKTRLFKILELSLKSPTVPIIVILSFIKKLVRICLISTANNIAILLGIIQNIIRLHPRSILLLIRNKKIKRGGKVKFSEKVKEDSQFNWDNYKVTVNKESNEQEEELKDEIKSQVKMQEDYTSVRGSKFEKIDEESFYAKFEQFDDEELDTYKTGSNMSCLWELYTLKNNFSFKIRAIVNKFEKNFLKLKEFDLNSFSNLEERDLIYEVKDTAHFYVSNNGKTEDYNLLNDKIKTLI